MPTGPLTHLFAAVFIGGILFCIAACARAWKTRRFATSARVADGTVIRFEHITDVEGPNTFAPVVRFTPHAGAEVEFTDRVSSSWPKQRIGEQVRVLYDPDNPGKAHIAGGFRLYLGVWVILAIGLACTAIGAAGYLATAKVPQVATASTSNMDWNTSRRHGAFYRSIELGSADAESCREACAENVACKSWTYVKPDPAKNERQWCQFQTDAPKPVADECCVSGEIKR